MFALKTSKISNDYIIESFPALARLTSIDKDDGTGIRPSSVCRYAIDSQNKYLIKVLQIFQFYVEKQL